jgi:hypothetical protein
MPSFNEDEIIRRTVQCTRCQQPATYTLDIAHGNFSYVCECTMIEAPEIHTGPNGPGEIRLMTLPGRMIGIRPSRRLLSKSRGRLWREVWRCEQGVIVGSGADFVTIPNDEAKPQFWAHSFEESYMQLVGQPWRPEGGLL